LHRVTDRVTRPENYPVISVEAPSMAATDILTDKAIKAAIKAAVGSASKPT
jgi:hypothetical protein